MIPAVILCGGLGTRLRSVLADLPKVLAPVRGRPFLACLLRTLQKQGVTEVILSTGYQGEKVETFVGDGSEWSLRARCIREEEELGTGGALRYIVECANLTGPFLAMNGDTFFGGSLRELIRFHRGHADAVATIALVQIANLKRYGHVTFSRQTGEIVGFEEKDSGLSKRPAWISAGVYVLEPSVLSPIAHLAKASIERQVFPHWVGKGLYGCAFPGADFLDIGVPEDLKKAEQLLECV